MKIGEVAVAASLAKSAIRFYEKAGLLTAPRRNGGMRVYKPDVLHELTIIRVAREVSFTLPEIKLLLHGFSATTAPSVRWRKLARRKIEELQETIAKAQAMKKTLESLSLCRCRRLDDCARILARRQKRTPSSRTRED